MNASASPPDSPLLSAMRLNANVASSTPASSPSSSRHTTQSGLLVNTTVPLRPFPNSKRLPATTSAPPTPAVSLITATPGSVSTTSPIATLLSSVFVAANENRLLGTGRTNAIAERASEAAR